MRYIVDRIEEGIVVLSSEGGDIKSVSLSIIGDVRDGDVLGFDGESYRLLENETDARKKSLAERFEKLKNRR